MNHEKPLEGLPKNFQNEEKDLLSNGINSWGLLRSLKDEEICALVKTGRGTTSNFKRIRGIALLICEIELSQENAALLLHSGVASVKALAALTPQELVNKTGRLERQLNTCREPLVDLATAKSWIQKAKDRQMVN